MLFSPQSFEVDHRLNWSTAQECKEWNVPGPKVLPASVQCLLLAGYWQAA